MNSNLPVMVVIHGGAYTNGAGQEFGPDFMLNAANLVMVSENNFQIQIVTTESLYFNFTGHIKLSLGTIRILITGNP